MGKAQRQKHGSRARERDEGDGTRTVRLQELIREEVNFLLQNEARDARLQGVAVTMVQLAGDGSCARLWFTAPTDEDRSEALARASGFLRNRLADSLALKRTPDLRFRRDPATRAFAASSDDEAAPIAPPTGTRD
jgi:ribosome-binding factor A